MPREPQKDDLSLAFDRRIKEQVATMPTNPTPPQYCLWCLWRTTLATNSILIQRTFLNKISTKSGSAVAHLTLVVNWTPVLMTKGRSGCMGMQGCRSTTKALKGKEDSSLHTMQWTSLCPVPLKWARLLSKDVIFEVGGAGDDGKGQDSKLPFH